MKTTNQIKFKIPYALRHMQAEVKSRGGRYQPEDQTWALDETDANQTLAARISAPPQMPSIPAAERVRNVAQTATELLNALKIGRFTLVEATPARIVIEEAIQA